MITNGNADALAPDYVIMATSSCAFVVQHEVEKAGNKIAAIGGCTGVSRLRLAPCTLEGRAIWFGICQISSLGVSNPLLQA